jgi:hypothetical protein
MEPPEESATVARIDDEGSTCGLPISGKVCRQTYQLANDEDDGLSCAGQLVELGPLKREGVVSRATVD